MSACRHRPTGSCGSARGRCCHSRTVACPSRCGADRARRGGPEPPPSPGAEGPRPPRPEAGLSNRARMRRCFRQGGLVFAERAGKPSMAALYRRRGATLDLVVLGSPDGDLAPRRNGVSFALELFVFEHAHALGCTTVDFGGSRPSPADGLLAYKARWGSRIVTTRSMFYDLALGWDRLTPVLLAFLAKP